MKRIKEELMPQCAAKAKSTGTRCRRDAVNDRKVCVVHGGKTPRGLASPHFKHGRYSKDLPSRLIADYEAALSDPDLIVLREELAILATREADLLRRVDQGEAGALWAEAARAFGGLEAALLAKDQDRVKNNLRRLRCALDSGKNDSRAWRELREVIQERRQLAEAERKRLQAITETMTAEQAMLFAVAILDSVRRHESDGKILGAIGADINRVLVGAGRTLGGERPGGTTQRP